MENNDIKICPFNMKPCMELDCALADEVGNCTLAVGYGTGNDVLEALNSLQEQIEGLGEMIADIEGSL